MIPDSIISSKGQIVQALVSYRKNYFSKLKPKEEYFREPESIKIHIFKKDDSSTEYNQG